MERSDWKRFEMKPKITVEIDAAGATTIAVSGVVGKSCVVLTRDLEDALGVKTATRPNDQCVVETKQSASQGA